MKASSALELDGKTVEFETAEKGTTLGLLRAKPTGDGNF